MDKKWDRRNFLLFASGLTLMLLIGAVPVS